MSQEYTITHVGPSREWSNKRGDRFLAYEIQVEGDDRTIEWSRKPDSDPPEVGKTTPLADIENGSHGPKLKVDWNALKEQGGSTSSGGSKNFKPKEWQPESERDPERSARILRQHSQSAALEYAKLTGALSDLSEAITEPRKTVPDFFWRLVDQFDADVLQTAQKAGGVALQGETSLSTPATPPAAQEAQSNAEYLSRLLEQAGFPLIQIPPVQRYIEAEVHGERRQKLESALGSSDIDFCASAVTQLIAETEIWTGEKLPTPTPDDGIPF